MEFKVIKDMMTSKEKALVIESTINTIDVEGQSMNIGLITDKMIEENDLKEVTSSIFFKSGSEPTEDGLFSEIIFGSTSKERSMRHAYIDLKRKFFHPYVYEVVTSLNPKIEKVASGEGSWIIDEEGKLEQITDDNDTRYDETNTGLGWLIENFKKIKFKDSDALSTNTKLKFIKSLSEDEMFISKWIVIPVFFRDVQGVGGNSSSVPEINYMYNELITYCRSYGNEILDMTRNLTLNKIQNTLVKIRKFGQKLVEKKNGAFQKTILGKAPDYGGRGVISAPSLNGCDVPNDCLIDVTHAGIPMTYCITSGYPFIIKWITEFFDDAFRNKTHIPVYEKNRKGEYELKYVEIEDQSEVYTKEFIDKKLEMFTKTFGAERFETIKIKCKDGKERELYFPGKGYTKNPDDPLANTIGNRPLTWTDVIYLAAVETLSDKYCYITRYPLEDYFGIFPCQISVLSTIKTIPVIINGKVYKHYPDIRLDLPPSEVATQFIDTISFSNLYLDAIGGD